jgi:hypothetical protein
MTQGSYLDRLRLEIFLFGGLQPTSADYPPRRMPPRTTVPANDVGDAAKLKWRYDEVTRDIVYLV